MSGKTVEFKTPARKRKQPVPAADEWVAKGEAADTAEPMKRFTIDVSLSLHTRIKTQCARRGVKMADEIRALLAKHFPEES